MAEYLVAGLGVVGTDSDSAELNLAGLGNFAEPGEDLAGGGFPRPGGWRGYARTRYIFRTSADDGVPPTPEPETLAPHLVRIPFKRLSPNRYLFNPSVEGVEQLNDAGPGFVVIPVWDGFRLARAGRFYYQSRNDFVVPPEPETLAPHVVRVPFKGFRPNPYIRTSRRDDTFVAPEPETLAPHLVRVPFKPYRPNLYVRTSRRDDTAPAEPPISPPHPPRPGQLKRTLSALNNPKDRFATSRYVFHHATDSTLLVAADTPAAFLVRVRYRTYAQNRHVFSFYYAQSVPAPSGFQAGWADESTVTINANRIDRGVIA